MTIAEANKIGKKLKKQREIISYRILEFPMDDSKLLVLVLPELKVIRDPLIKLFIEHTFYIDQIGESLNINISL